MFQEKHTLAEEQNPQSSPAEDSSGAASNDSEAQPQETDQSGASTLEEVEAYWRKRMSNSDKAHAAAAKALQEQLSEAQQRAEARSAGNVEALDAQAKEALAAAERRVAEADARVKAAELKSQYPLAIDAVGAEAAGRMTPEALASLNTKLDFDATVPRIDKNNPAAAPRAANKTIDEMSVEETIAHLRSLPYQAG